MTSPSVFCSKRKHQCIALVGVLFVITGLVLLLTEIKIVEYVIASIMVLKPNSTIVSSWKKLPLPLPTDVYFFNWTNPEDFHNPSIKPRFEEVGPYRFLQNMEKINVVWNSNDTVTFNQVRYWHFDENYTKGSLSDNITSINAITLGSSHYMRNWGYLIKRVASVLLTAIAPDLHVTRSVNQLLFEGYNDLIVDIARYLPFIASQVPRFDRFGWFRIMNGSKTFEGVFNMANGVNGNFEVLNWNYNNTTPYFTDECAKVHGSGGELYSAKPPKTHVGIFLTHFCRHFRFDYEREVLVNGVLGYKYVIGDGVLDNGTKIQGNECFCAGDCLPSGMINVSSCRYGSPTYASLPNFYYADPVYLNAVEGLHPEKKKHEAYIILEPTTGIPLEVVVRLQLNILVQPVEGISMYEEVRKMYFPLLWVELKANLPDDAMMTLKILLVSPYIIAGVAIFVMSVGLYILISVFLKGLIDMYKRVREKDCLMNFQETLLQLAENEKKVFTLQSKGNTDIKM